jgi:DNA-binding response OmpR family regulator
MRATFLLHLPRFLRAGNVDIDLDAYSVAVEDRTVHLTRQEFLLLYLLTVNANRIVTPAQLIEFACDATTSPDPALVKTLLSRVRRKLQDAGHPMISIAAIFAGRLRPGGCQRHVHPGGAGSPEADVA